MEKIELSGSNITLRLIAAGLFLLIGALALAYSFGQLFAVEGGWQEIEAGASDGPTCAGEFTLFYELGAEGRAPEEENRALSALYTQTCRTAYQLFHTMEGFDGVVNLWELSRRPNEALEVDPMLYRAFEAVREAGERTVYLGPVYARYGDLFRCQDDVMLVDFDPRLSGEVAAEYAAYAAYAADPAHIEVELLGENRLRLRISEEYLAFARQESVVCFLDFGWLRNAFVADCLTDALAEGGFTCGTIASWDGFARCLDGREGRTYALELLDELEEGRPICAGTAEYQGPMSLAALRRFPAAERDWERFYRLRDGQVRTMYLDPADGLCRGAADFLAVYAGDWSCARLAMEAAPVFIAETLDREALERLPAEGIGAVLCQGRSIWTVGPPPAVTGLYDGFTLNSGWNL